MPEIKETLHSVPTRLILDLVRELTIGQRSTETLQSLTAFLHRIIFPQLGPFAMEIFFSNSSSGHFFPPQSVLASRNPPGTIPTVIPHDHDLIRDLQKNGIPKQLNSQDTTPDFLYNSKNIHHILTPIQDEEQLKALLYLGCQEPCSFSSDFISSIHTLAAVIGSRLKSMKTIRHLNESMFTLEQSEQLKTALYKISKESHTSANINELYSNLHHAVGRLMYARNFFIALEEDNTSGKSIKFPYYADDNNLDFHNHQTGLDNENLTLTGFLLKSQQPLLLTPANFEQVCSENKIVHIGTKPHSWLGAPFKLEHIAGVVGVQSYEHIVYTEKDKELITYVARHIGDALNRKGAADEMKKAKELAEEAERNKSTFLANMSHEIRTPMNGILGLTDLVLASELTDQQQNYLELVRSSSKRLINLINDILDFSKIEAAKFNLTISPFSLQKAIADALQLLAISAGKKNIDLNMEYAESIPDFLLGDADKLGQIFINLVGNGLKFTDQGSVTLSVQEKNNHATQPDHVSLHFQIKDTGIGIPADRKDDVFKAFSQLGTTRNSNHRGTGLGLVIAAELVEMMGGKINLESQPGVGTTFQFTLDFPICLAPPLPKTKEKHLPSSQENSPLKPVPLRVLLVEDEFINQTLAVALLEREGWQVTCVENGLLALDILDTDNFDLILMDIQMPELDGYETTKIIRKREQESGKHLPIIAMTAYAARQDRDLCFEAGMDGYISKPIRSNLLRVEIEAILAKS